MKKIFLVAMSFIVFAKVNAQTVSLYNPTEDAQKEIDYAVMVAKSKKVLLQMLKQL